MRMERWNVVFLIGFIVYLTIRGVFKQRTKGNEKVVSRVDTRERILLVLVIATSFFAPMLYLFTPWLSFADYRLPEWAPWCGLVSMTVAIWLFWRSHADLGRNWSVTLEVRKGHEVVRRGVYRFIRHPMYASIWLWGLAQGMMLANWFAGWSVMPVFAAMYFIRMPREERLMCEEFGDGYREYARRTGRVFPRLTKGS